MVYPDGVQALAAQLAPGVDLVALFNVGVDPDVFKANPEFRKGVDTMLRRVREREGVPQPPPRP